MDPAIRELLNKFLPNWPEVIGTKIRNLLRLAVPIVVLEESFHNGYLIPVVQVTTEPLLVWKSRPCCGFPVCQELFEAVMSATLHITHASCPICYAQIYPFMLEKEDFGYIIFRPRVIGQRVRYGNSDNPRVYSKVDQLIVMRSVSWQLVESQRLFVYSVSEACRQFNYCFDDYDEAVQAFDQHVQKIQEWADSTWRITRVSANRGLPHDVSFVDFVEIMRFLSTALEHRSILDDRHRRQNVQRVLSPLMFTDRLINCLSDIYGAYNANPERVKELYICNYGELTPEEATMARRIHSITHEVRLSEGNMAPATFDSGLPERRFRRFDVT